MGPFVGVGTRPFVAGCLRLSGVGEGVDVIEEAVDVAAPAGVVYGLLADLPRMGEWSPECRGATWRRGFDLLVRTPKETERTRKMAQGFDLFKDGNNGNLIYVNEKGHLAVVAAEK